MRLVCISDTHSLHHKMSLIPDGDVLVHAGDCTGSGSLPQLDDFVRWLGALPHKHKILIAGNHDFCFERYPEWARGMSRDQGITYLQDEAVTIDGLTFFGSPWSPVFRQMAFNAREEEMFEHRALIPSDTQVLITHGPAFQIFDFVPDVREHVGCYPLAKRIDELPALKVHVCGHIHESYGFAIRESDGVKFANASTCTERYRASNPPIIIDV
ncbi:metallophosphatase domain-containing protein [Marinobacter changyiensis]|uniref:metallophosphatase domain-containing protein n=1 Tax=Marinobacter changyiensis TaxID=2604091 RepID=UPI0012654675|nr:metallophosphatase domain-containing protein [Marinobacter changyiensis]